MKLNCNIIQDVLPLVVEDLASEDTVELVNEHIKKCSKCSKEYEELKASKTNFQAENESETIPLKNIKRKLKNKNIYIGILSALIISLLLIIVLNIATKPIPLLYKEAIESTEIEDGKIFVKFKPEVSNYNVVSHDFNHDIMAWKTNISKFFDSGEAKNTVISIDEEKPVLINYISQGSELDRLIYGEIDYGGRITLPRLAMNYYLLIMIIVFIITIILFFIFKNRAKIQKIVKTIMIFPLSYILGHIVIFGGDGTTHHMMRDLFFVIVGTLLFFSIFILLIYKDDFMKIKGNMNK